MYNTKVDYTKIITKIRRSICLVFSISGGKITSKGSGFIFSEKGIIVTCNHVVKDSDSVVKIKFPDSEIMDAKIVIRDLEHDLVLLKFDDSSRNPLLELDNAKIKEGMPVIFSGFPLTMENLTTHQGILSAILKDPTGITLYLIDGTVNAGNSGCPLMDSEGKVFGVVNAKRREQSSLLEKVEQMTLGALSLHGIDIVQIYKAIISNVQLGIGYAVPSSYIPPHVKKEIKNNKNKK